MLVAFGATANHCAFYTMSGSTLKAFKNELEGYDTSKGTIRFQPDKPLPTALVRKLVKAQDCGEPRSRHSMGQGYAYPVSVLSGDVAARSEAWRSINDLVPHTAVIAQLNDTAPDGDTTVCIAAADWPVVVALDGQRPLRDLVGPTRMTSFAICEAVHRLITAGLVTVIDDGSY